MKLTKNKKNTVGSLSAYAELLSNMFVHFLWIKLSNVGISTNISSKVTEDPVLQRE